MTKFTDGPAQGKILQLLRLPMPIYLRVVRGPDGKIDALDQVDDEPEEGEELFAYKKSSDDGTRHVDGRDKDGKRFGRWYNSCTYALCQVQPTDEQMRTVEAWRAWCVEQAGKESK